MVYFKIYLYVECIYNILLYLCIVIQTNIINFYKSSIMVNKNFSKLLNSNFLCKIGRTLYGFAGMCRILGCALAEHIISKALRSKLQVFRYKATKVGMMVSLYSK